jgi:hypothetical protein
MDGEDFAGAEVGNGDVVVVGEREDACAGVFGADAEVVHAAGAAQAHLAFGVEPVVAQAVVAGRVAVAGRGGLRSRSVCLPWRSALKGAVGAAFVVVLTELIELLLEFGDRSCRWPGREPALQRLVETFGLALGLGVSWGPIFCRMPSSGRTYSNALRPPVKREV